jgi:hypothetical protein
MKTAPPVNYRLPLLATIASTLVVIILFAILAFFTTAWSIRQFTSPEGEGVGSLVISGVCGLATILLIAGLLYFSVALIKGVRDLTTPIVRLPGYIERKYTGMGRTGGFWIIVQPGERPEVASTPRLAAALAPAAEIGQRLTPGKAQDPNPSPAQPPTPNPQPPTPSSGFGAALEEVARHTRSTTPPPASAALAPEPVQNPKSKIQNSTARIFRVDKPVYNALRDGEPVTVAYSPFLEHVYYVEHLEAGEPVPLRNTSLI